MSCSILSRFNRIVTQRHGIAPERVESLILRLRILIALLFAVFASLSAQPVNAATDNLECQKCHGDTGIAKQKPESLLGMVHIPAGTKPVLRSSDKIPDLLVPPEAFKSSAHGGMACTDCHVGVKSLPHEQRLATLQCADCHAGVQRTLSNTPHGGQGTKGGMRLSCADCHGGPHEILAANSPRAQKEGRGAVAACSKCHDHTGAEGFNPVNTYEESVHGRGLFSEGLTVSATCVDCHGSHNILPRSNSNSSLSPQNTPKTCGKCHEGIETTFMGSIHGTSLLKGRTDAPTCTSCHSSHGITKVEKGYLTAFVKECSTCHEKLGKSYLASYHGKATQLSVGSAAVCSSCHGAHNILPPSDPRSNVAPANLEKTCGTCHKNINQNFVKYIAHMNVLDRKGQPAVFYTFIFMTTLLLGVLAFFIPHTLLYLQRSGIQHFRHNGISLARTRKDDRMIRRFEYIHRITHALVVISFMGLVATGFPLKYSYTDWAKHIATFFGGAHVMGLLHRTFAVITLLYVVVHLFFLFYFFTTRCPRPRWKYLFGPESLVLNLKDIRDLIAMLRWFFWLGPRPRFGRWTYFEKFDYWGETWGVIIIGGTGLLLWAPTLFTRWLPGWVLNCATVVHSIEALLAASVIFLVHFVNTHLRPEKFPIDMVMFTGQMPESELKEERPAEYERLKKSGELEHLVEKPVSRRLQFIGAIAGIAAFMIGIAFIVLAFVTEIWNLFQ